MSISGGTPPYEISWTNQLTGEEINPSMLLGGEDGITYNLVVTDQNQCIQTNTFIINPEPEEIIIENLDEMTSNYNGYEISCNGYNDGYIDLDVSGGILLIHSVGLGRMVLRKILKMFQTYFQGHIQF